MPLPEKSTLVANPPKAKNPNKDYNFVTVGNNVFTPPVDVPLSHYWHIIQALDTEVVQVRFPDEGNRTISRFRGGSGEVARGYVRLQVATYTPQTVVLSCGDEKEQDEPRPNTQASTQPPQLGLNFAQIALNNVSNQKSLFWTTTGLLVNWGGKVLAMASGRLSIPAGWLGQLNVYGITADLFAQPVPLALYNELGEMVYSGGQGAQPSNVLPGEYLFDASGLQGIQFNVANISVGNVMPVVYVSPAPSTRLQGYLGRIIRAEELGVIPGVSTLAGGASPWNGAVVDCEGARAIGIFLKLQATAESLTNMQWVPVFDDGTLPQLPAALCDAIQAATFSAAGIGDFKARHDDQNNSRYAIFGTNMTNGAAGYVQAYGATLPATKIKFFPSFGSGTPPVILKAEIQLTY
jgi:hypothetical protein